MIYRVGVYKCLSRRLCRHCRNLAEGGCLFSRFRFMRCRYFLGHVACRNLPWQGLYYGQFALSLGKESSHIFSKFNLLIWTLSVALYVFILMGFDCILVFIKVFS